MLGETEGNGKREVPRKRWIESINEAVDMSLQELSKAAEDRRAGHHTFIGWPGIGADSTSRSTRRSSINI